MRKFWGWVLFLIAWTDAGILWYNFAIAPWKDELVVEWVLLPYLIVMGLSFFGWYWLAICKTKAVK